MAAPLVPPTDLATPEEAKHLEPSPVEGLFPTARGAHRSVWLFWLGFGLSCTLTSAGWSPLVSQLAGFLCFAAWVANNVDASKITWEMLFMLTDIFFREVGVRGQTNVPKHGPCILACGPHANQFLDPVVVASTSQRDDIGFIVAAVTTRRKFVGALARLIRGIPVERPQDLAKPLQGTISVQGAKVTGKGTKFTATCGARGQLFVKGSPTLQIEKVVDDTTLELRRGADNPINDVSCKHAPHIPQENFFTEVFNRLRNGKAVAVFPEGGSHDNTSLLALKPGVALMALKASVLFGRPVPVIPVGLNYFKGHRFRSRVFVDFQPAIYVSEEDVKLYSEGDSEDKKTAAARVLNNIREGMRNAMVEAPNYHTLTLFWTLRRLYVPTKAKIDSVAKQRLTRGFAEQYDKFKENPEVVQCLKSVSQYTDLLKQYGLRDYMVAKRMREAVESGSGQVVDNMELYSRLLYRLCLLIVWGLLWVPAGLLALPHVLISKHVAHKKAKEAVKNSSVKIAGRDVLGTWKVLTVMGLFPALHLVYTVAAYLMGGETWAVAYFFFMPFISFYNLKAQENLVRLFQSLKPIFLMINNNKLAEELVALREVCRTQTIKVVEEIGWGIPMSFQCDDPPPLLSSKHRNSSFGSIDWFPSDEPKGS
mmetsp:Transcript_56832/g.124670  ORF Transcript_56832/g.124670 Transcript_56832/m.124670 type:complete len:650 (-) Transcript_56832:197-2146(-)